MKKIILLSSFLFLAACGTTQNDGGVYNFSDGTVGVVKIDVESEWVKRLGKTNESLHDAVIAAMLVSRKTGKEVFVQKKKEGDKKHYYLSYVRGDSENVLGYLYNTRFISFNHYSSEDGPSFEEVANQVYIDTKVKEFYKELGIK